MSIWEWFNAKLKMKRWLILILAGVLVISYSLAKIFSAEILEVGLAIRYGLLFVLGAVCVCAAYILSQRQLLISVADAATKSNGKSINLKKLLYDKSAIDKGIKIVVIGGGAGLATVLKGLKDYSNHITAIVNTASGGNSEDVMTKEFGILPPNDIRQSLVALSSSEEKMQELMRYRFKTGTLKGQNFANLLLIAMNDICDHNFAQAIQDTSEVLSVTGKVLPVTLDKVNIGAILKDGTRVVGEDNITDKVLERQSPIEKIFLQPSSCEPAPGVIKSIKEADMIVIGPGSLYTGIIPNMLLKEVADTIKRSQALKIFVSNIMTEPGQTDHYNVSDLVNAIHEHIGKGVMDYCLVNESDIMPEYIRRYNEEGADLLELDKTAMKATGVQVVISDLAATDEKGYIRHDARKLGKAIMTILCDNMDLRHDKHAFEAYMIKSKLNAHRKKKKNIMFQPVKVVKSTKRKVKEYEKAPAKKKETTKAKSKK